MPALRRLDPRIRVLTREQARRLGFSSSDIDYRLRTSRWQAILPRTYLTAPEPTRLDRLRAAVLFSGDGSCLSGADALELHGIRCPPARRVLVLAPPRRKQWTTDWLQVRPTTRLPAPAWTAGIPIAPAARSVADWALQSTSIFDVRAVVARALQSQACTPAQLSIELAEGPRNGSARLRQAILEIEAGSRSAPEAEAAQILTAAGLTGFRQNASVGPYVVDFLWPELNAVLEIDSVDYHFNRDDWAETLTRHRELESMGYSVIHIRPSELADPRAFIAAVRAWLVGRAAAQRTAS